ncbi:MAG: hypothetical protein JSV75_01495 [Candidatus Bathyarchaeota archaeon]|nr:MAG: hypothetical protein JSV75_01495 [Candidatus Bathyarchaeota archaeon]
MKTQKRWIEKGVNLNLLTENIETYFQDKGFKTRKDALPTGAKILIAPKHLRDPNANIKVTVLGSPQDFTVELSISEPSRFATILGLSTTLFGGGIFVLRGLKLQESLEKLEKKFWSYLEEKITYASRSYSEGTP